MERETGFGPATFSLATRCSTTELFPLAGKTWYHSDSQEAGRWDVSAWRI